MKKTIFRIALISIFGVYVYINYIKSDVSVPDQQINLDQDKGVPDYKKDTLLNTNTYLVLGNNTIVKQVKIADTIHYNDFFQMAWFNNEVIIANRRNFEGLGIYLKRASIDMFEKYKVPVYQGILKEPDFTSNPEAKMFITRIKEGCKSGINFAGHYTLIYWGCGTACQSGVIVDRKTGVIYDGYMSSLGSEFQKDSNFIIFNADDEDNNALIPMNINQNVQITLKFWKGNAFKPVKR